mmetsp:Transcript_13442/g.31942  ORF Transcript_13442/g.31942 Transcript_13442/m.31942 type:complete len:89 (+) Transcript_13442:81-347(+)
MHVQGSLAPASCYSQVLLSKILFSSNICNIMSSHYIAIKFIVRKIRTDFHLFSSGQHINDVFILHPNTEVNVAFICKCFQDGAQNLTF